MSFRRDAAHSILQQTGVPGGWKDYTVGEIAKMFSGGTPNRGEGSFWRDGSIPWITPTDLTANANRYISNGEEHITEAGLHGSNATLLKPGTIIFSSRGTVGNLAIAKVPLTINQSCEALRPRWEDWSPLFLYYLLGFGMSAFHRLAGGTTFGAITRREIARVRFAFPPPAEQEAIAQVLDAADEAIECTRAALCQTNVLVTALLHELLTGAGERLQQAGKPLTRLDAVATVDSGVTLGKDVTGFKTVTRPYLRVANVQDGHLNLDVVKQVTVRLSEVEKFELQPGDVLMTEGGDFDKLGRGAIWEGQIPGCLHQNHVFRIRADRSKLDPRYFACVVESNIAKAYFNRVAKRTTNLASTNKTQVRALRFPLPDLSEQERIADVLEASKNHGRALRTQLAAQEALKAALLRDLLTGRVRVGAAHATVAA